MSPPYRAPASLALFFALAIIAARQFSPTPPDPDPAREQILARAKLQELSANPCPLELISSRVAFGIKPARQASTVDAVPIIVNVRKNPDGSKLPPLESGGKPPHSKAPSPHPPSSLRLRGFA